MTIRKILKKEWDHGKSMFSLVGTFDAKAAIRSSTTSSSSSNGA